MQCVCVQCVCVCVYALCSVYLCVCVSVYAVCVCVRAVRGKQMVSARCWGGELLPGSNQARLGTDGDEDDEHAGCHGDEHERKGCQGMRMIIIMMRRGTEDHCLPFNMFLKIDKVSYIFRTYF